MLPRWPESAPLLCAMAGLFLGDVLGRFLPLEPGKRFSFAILVMMLALVLGIWLRDRRRDR